MATPGARPDTAETLERHTRAVRLRRAGIGYERIATELGYASASGARNAVMTLLRDNAAEAVDEMRLVENARLDAMTAALEPRVTAGDPRAVEAALKVSHRRAALNGLDAPKQIALQMPLRSDIDDAFASLEESLGDLLTSRGEPADHLPETPGS